jgi:LysR family hydrogen peroxide-inducible transcriptional activator
MKTLPSPRQLAYLVALSETNHFGRAAAACYVTQPALSAGLRELEEVLRVSLVDRTRHSVIMTPLGRMLAARAREALKYLDDIVELAQASSAPLTGPLTLGAIPTICPYLTPHIFSTAKKEFPALDLFVREEQTAGLLTRLERGNIDMALLALPYDTGGFGTAIIGEESVVACIPAKHPLAKKRSLSVDDIGRAPLLTLEDGHCLRNHSLAICHMGKKRLNEIFQATSLATLVQMVAAGHGLALLPTMAVNVETIGRRNIVVRAISGAPPARQLALCWRAASIKSEDFERFAELCRAAFRSHQQAMLPALRRLGYAAPRLSAAGESRSSRSR